MTGILEYTFAPPLTRLHPRNLPGSALYLQSILEQLVHLGHLRRHGKVNGAVGNLDNQSAADLGVDLGHNLELLAVGDVLGLVDRSLEAAERAVVEGLSHTLVSNPHLPPFLKC